MPSAPVRDDNNDDQNVFENPSFQAASIPITLGVMLVTLDRCREIMKHAAEIRTLTAPKQAASGALTSRRRRELEAAIDAFWIDVEAKALAELTDQGLIDADADPADLIYPLTKEEACTVEEMILGRVKSDAVKAHFSKYLDKLSESQYILSQLRLGPPGANEAMLGSALLPLAISALEEYVGAMIRSALALHQNALGALPNVPTEIVRRYQGNISSADILRWQLDQKIGDFLRGSPEDWQQTILKWAKIDLTSLGGGWDGVIEAIQRRHVITHNRGRADKEYLTKVAASLTVGLEPGSILTCNEKYVESMLINLEAWVICLAILWAKHFFTDDARYYTDFIGRIVNLESKGRWAQTLAILDTFLAKPLPTDPGRVALAHINRWFCLQEMGCDSDAQDREILLWRPASIDDDLELSRRIEIGKAALLRHYDTLKDLIRAAFNDATHPISKEELREMPLLKRAMDENASIRALLRGPERPPIRVSANTRTRSRRRSK